MTDFYNLLRDQLPSLTTALVSLPVAAILGAVLAFRPRRRGTPPHDSQVIHTQIILAVVGALVMLVIGESLARAFGIVGAAGLIRYRARIRDPKDAGVMLCTLGIGLASGVGLYLLAILATVFLLLVLWIVESHTPRSLLHYELKIETGDPFGLRPRIEAVLEHYDLEFILRSCSDGGIRYTTYIPVELSTDLITAELKKLEANGATSFQLERKREA